jgi:hypothetical protein
VTGVQTCALPIFLDLLLVKEVVFVSIIIVENKVHLLVFLVSKGLKVAIFA